MKDSTSSSTIHEMKMSRTCQHCGQECKGKRGIRIHLARAHDDETSTTAPCNWCGEELNVRVWEADQRHYCSRECSDAWNAYIRSGENHPNHQDGSSRGPAYDLLKMYVRWRDDGTCQRCGRERDENGRRMDVHHITPESDADCPHRPSNLITVCRGCHQELESESREDQLAECGIESVNELEFSGQLAEQYRAKKEETDCTGNAPSPRPGMFAEAQRLQDERK